MHCSIAMTVLLKMEVDLDLELIFILPQFSLKTNQMKC